MGRASPLAALTLLAASCATWASTGSVWRERCTHVGVRPASDGLGDYAVTLQVSTDAPVCREVYTPRPRAAPCTRPATTADLVSPSASASASRASVVPGGTRSASRSVVRSASGCEAP